MGIFDKVKEIASNSINTGKETGNEETIKSKISEGILLAVNKVSEEREHYYNKNNVPSIDSIDNIISDYSNKNALISGGASIIPGPLGMAAAIPEIIAVINNQLKMIYDIAKANGQKEINKELLITVLLSAMGNASGNLLIVHGQKIMAKRVGARVLQTLIKLLGGKITQQIAKSMAAKWIPIAGAIAMAAWSKYTTNKIGQKAKEVFSKEIVFENSEINESNIIDIVDEKINFKSIQKTKVQILINLIKIDNNIDSSEIKFIEDFMDKIELDIDDKMDLIQQLNNQNKISVDYNILKNNNEEILYLLIDLVTLAKIDNEFHITEKLFIKEIAKILEFNQEELQLLMES